MKICRLRIKNFGKLKNRDFVQSEGIQLFYGENESGKSTIHTFIKGMLFGIERGRGRASINDTFSIYEPWDDPSHYRGSLQFESGGKHFWVHRNFDKYSKKAELICEEDGEEFSIEKGDLDMLLSGMDRAGYENTISIGQLKAEPSQPLAVRLKNFATNYYAAGASDLDLPAALERLEERRRQIDRAKKEFVQKRQKKREQIEQEASYIWREIHKLQEEEDVLEAEIVSRREHSAREEQEKKGVMDEIRPSKWRIHPVEILLFILIVVFSFILIQRPWNYLVAIVLFLCCGIYVWNRLKVGKGQEKTEPEKLLEEITPKEEKEPLERLVWERDHLRAERKEKQIQYDNLQEQLEELEEVGREAKELDQQREGVLLAVEKLNEVSQKQQGKLEGALNAKVSEIMKEITGGKYTRFLVEEPLKLSLILEDGRKVGIEKLSRGTIEQIYFALRMAAGELLYEEEYPVLLDDTFAYYDDERLKNTLAWLEKNRKQVIIFTCQNREEEALLALDISYKKEVV